MGSPLRRMFRKYLGRCVYCSGIVREGSIEHVLPRSYGGDSSPQNKRLACKGCNNHVAHLSHIGVISFPLVDMRRMTWEHKAKMVDALIVENRQAIARHREEMEVLLSLGFSGNIKSHSRPLVVDARRSQPTRMMIVERCADFAR